ncbi:HER118Wp [Eremothecium sinecaudum]|uniref:HER118Wp n=1 Tax=Eremothecium sinecaudum TaxID=45286 RepID=A0A0X8HTU5_9SACH|nr:HER118Wp [Eremothecium sinecaudum]AMD21397.1 HER118Wp [Eremothecium sinecaudum]
MPLSPLATVLKIPKAGPFLRYQISNIHYTTRMLGAGMNNKASTNRVQDNMEKTLGKNFTKHANEENTHDHIHTSESRTESSSSFRLGSMATRVPVHEKLHMHSHNHSHTHGNPLLVMSKEEFRKNRGVRITWIGLLSNIGLAAGKFVGGIVFHSQALLADAVHALSDLVSDLMTLYAVSFANKKPSNDYPYGHGKIETLGSLAVSSILTMAGLSIGWSSLCALVGPFVPHAILEIISAHGHSHSHHNADLTNINAAWIALGSIILKEWIFRATKKVAIETDSNVLMANAWHHRIDSLTSLVALVTISSGYFLNVTSLDAFGGLLVSALVVNTGFRGITQAANELIDRSLPETEPRYLEVKEVTSETLKNMRSNNNSGKPYVLKNLVVMVSGPNAYANMLIEVPLQRWDNVLTLEEFELVTDHIRAVLYKNLPYLKTVNIEFTGERPELQGQEAEEVARQREQYSINVPETKLRQRSKSHSHSHWPFSGDHSH